MGLSEQDRAELRGLGQGQVPAVVERIVARHVAAALAEAADRIDAEAVCTCGTCKTYSDAARIVRAAATNDST